ncbi:hypothetical protein GQ457_01G015870 [Hibiscus cannabinus]
MKILCWNCQGLGQSQVVYSLQMVVQKIDPDVIFLPDTRLHKIGFLNLKLSLDMVGYFMVDFTATCSGILLFWNYKVSMYLLSYSSRHIDVVIASFTEKFHFFRIIGYANTNIKI